MSAGVVLPLLNGLGWDVFDPSVVAPEYSVGGRRVDFALLQHGRPAVFVEVKQPGHGIGADRQLFEYAFHEGVPLAVLTDGATWHLYLPAMQGSYDERRVYLLDLLEREPAESAERLTRYLDREAVASGEAFERARQDYQRSRQRREAREAIPSAWQALIEAGDARLVDALASEVESRSGYRPEPEDVFGFLVGLVAPQNVPPKPLPIPPRPKTGPAQEIAEPAGASVQPAPRGAAGPRQPKRGRGSPVELPDGTELRAHHKGIEHHAVWEDGSILYNGDRYPSPSAAGTAVTGTSVNGWIFWYYRLAGTTRWALLDELRR